MQKCKYQYQLIQLYYCFYLCIFTASDSCSEVKVNGNDWGHSITGTFVSLNFTVNNRPAFTHKQLGLYLHYHISTTCEFWVISVSHMYREDGNALMMAYDVTNDVTAVQTSWQMFYRGKWMIDDNVSISCV